MDRTQQAINRAITDFTKTLALMAERGRIEDWQADTENWSLISFPQTWPSTALGFGGIGGQMISSAQTIIFTDHHQVFVYFGGGFAYELEKPSEKFWKDVASQNLADVMSYRREYERA